MAKVTVYHPDLDWSKQVSEDAARVLERSGWVIQTPAPKPATKKSKDATVGVQPATVKTEPTEDPTPSVSSDQPSSEE